MADDSEDCPLCHGYPKSNLGGIHAGIPDEDTGGVTCPNCGTTTDGGTRDEGESDDEK